MFSRISFFPLLLIPGGMWYSRNVDSWLYIVTLQNYVKAYGYTKRFFSVWFLRELQDAQAALEHVAAPKDADKKSMQAKLIESEAGMEFKDPDEHSLEGQYNRWVISPGIANRGFMAL